MTVRLIRQGSPEAGRIRPLSMAEQYEPHAEQMNVGRMPPSDTGHAAPALSVPPAGVDSAPAVDPAQIERTAFESGFRQGEKAGLEISEKKLEVIARRYGESILELGRAKASCYEQVEREIVRLALEVARKIVHREIQADPEIVQTLVRVALERVADRSVVTVRVNPLDHAFLLEKHPGWLQESGGGREVVLAADKNIERGGCLVQTDCGDVDARVEEQFREVERAFFEGGGQIG